MPRNIPVPSKVAITMELHLCFICKNMGIHIQGPIYSVPTSYVAFRISMKEMAMTHIPCCMHRMMYTGPFFSMGFEQMWYLPYAGGSKKDPPCKEMVHCSTDPSHLGSLNFMMNKCNYTLKRMILNHPEETKKKPFPAGLKTCSGLYGETQTFR